MAAKFDGKRASENHWVMQQNLAKQKGGRQPRSFQQPPPRLPKGSPPRPVIVVAEIPPPEQE
jgi:hypothetical protein